MKFDTLILGTPYIPSESTRRACKALHHFDMLLRADAAVKKKVAAWHGTTVKQMDEHKECVQSGSKCYQNEIS